MADEPRDDGQESVESPVEGGVVGDGADEGLMTGRSASVRFARKQAAVGNADKARMDTANQSLADALRITYGLLQFGMVVLLVLFVFSGFQKIHEGERGIAVFLGKPSSSNLEPGAHLTWPFPIGELIRVGGGSAEVPISRVFMPNRAGGASDNQLLDAPLDQFSGGGRLAPSRDGSLITADLNIAHTQWTANYHRSNHLRYVENIVPETERALVVVAVRRGVVRTMAETTIDGLLKESAEMIAGRVREIAQMTLDEFESGITIDRVVLVRKTPPLYLRELFASVQSAAQNAGKAREDALLERDQILNDVAGRAAPVLISMIDEYERFVEIGQDGDASELLAVIDTVLAGGEAEYDGQNTLALVSGEVSEILNEARSQATNRVSTSIAGLEQFRAKQAQYDANPALMVARDWSSAMAAFLNKDFVTTIYLPEGAQAELLINNDPDIEAERLKALRRRETLDQILQRREDFQREMFRSRRGIKAEDAE
jgi:modulator of FtsH protease HflK